MPSLNESVITKRIQVADPNKLKLQDDVDDDDDLSNMYYQKNQYKVKYIGWYAPSFPLGNMVVSVVIL